MNVKLIFVFTICIVLPNGLYSKDVGEHAPAKDEKEQYRQTLLQQWKPCKNGTFEEDEERNIYIRVLVKLGEKKSELYMVPDMKFIGVKVKNFAVTHKANVEVIACMTKLLQVSFLALDVEEGWEDELKTCKLIRGYRLIDDVIRIIVDKYVEMKFGGKQ